MLHRCSVRIASFFVSTGHVKGELADLCRYAIERRITSLAVFSFCTLISIWFMPISHLLIFTLFFVVPRKLLGGYHAKTPMCCALLTLFTIIAAGLLSKLLAASAFISLLVMCIGSASIVVFCPITANPVDNQSNALILSPRKKALKIIGAEIGLTLIGFATGLNSELLLCAALGMSCATISLLSLQNKKEMQT